VLLELLAVRGITEDQRCADLDLFQIQRWWLQTLATVHRSRRQVGRKLPALPVSGRLQLDGPCTSPLPSPPQFPTPTLLPTATTKVYSLSTFQIDPNRSRDLSREIRLPLHLINQNHTKRVHSNNQVPIDDSREEVAVQGQDITIRSKTMNALLSTSQICFAARRHRWCRLSPCLFYR